MINKIEKLKLLIFLGLIVSCTPNINNTLPVKSNSPTPSVSGVIIPTASPSSTSNSSTVPIVPISDPEKQIVNVMLYDGETLVNDALSYRKMIYSMLPNENKKFITKVVYKNGTSEEKELKWTTNKPDIVIIKEMGTISTQEIENINNTEVIITEQKSNIKINFTVWLQPEGNSYCFEPNTRYSYESAGSNDLGLGYFKGFIFDNSGNAVEGVSIKAKSIDPHVNWTGDVKITGKDGFYNFINAKIGSRVIIEATKDGWATRVREEIIKDNLYSEPCGNLFNFGERNKTDNNFYTLQDEPEIVSLKINGRQIERSSANDVFMPSLNKPKNSKPTPQQLDNSLPIPEIGNFPALTGFNNNKLEIEMIFSEPINVDDVVNNFRIISQTGFDNQPNSFIINSKTPGVEFDISADQKIITFKTNKPVLANRGGDEARYLIDFIQPFRDKTGKSAINKRYFRFSNTQINDFAVFSVKNDEEGPKLLNIVAKDGVSGANDTIELKYSEPLEIIGQFSYTSALIDSNDPSNTFRQLWYRDANSAKSDIASLTNTTADNNATLVGYLSGSDSDVNQFRASYMIGRILSKDITNGTPKMVTLGALGRAAVTTPVKGNTTANDLLRNARITGNNVLLEFSPTAFDRDDRVVVAVSKRIEGNYVDRNRTPSVNEELTVNVNPTVEYVGIYDPVGRLIDTGNYSTSTNIDVSNAQRVSTAS